MKGEERRKTVIRMSYGSGRKLGRRESIKYTLPFFSYFSSSSFLEWRSRVREKDHHQHYPLISWGLDKKETEREKRKRNSVCVRERERVGNSFKSSILNHSLQDLIPLLIEYFFSDFSLSFFLSHFLFNWKSLSWNL